MRAVQEMVVKVFSAFTTGLTSTHESFRSLSCKPYFDFSISSSRVLMLLFPSSHLYIEIT